MSVLTATKSTCAMPASIIRLTALSPPPPTPTTRITARYDAASPPTFSRGAPSGRGWMKRLTGGSYGGATGRAAAGAFRRAPAQRARSRPPARARTGLSSISAPQPGLVEIVDVLDGLVERDLLAAALRGRTGSTCSTVSSRAASSRRRCSSSRGPVPCPPARGSTSADLRALLLRARGGRQRRRAADRRSRRAERPRSRETTRRAAPHACSRVSAPWSTSFASCRYASEAVPFGSYPSTELPFTGASA